MTGSETVLHAPKIILLGASGQLGAELRRSLAPWGELTAPARAVCDLTRPAALRDYVRALRPDVIVNAAAWTDVEGAETAPDQAMAVNGEAPALLAREANALDALLVHYSSDYVFDGRLGRAYTEADTPNPLNAYGRSKLIGDKAVRQARRHVILRSGWIHGTHGRNFLKTLLCLILQRRHIEVVADQVGTPTGADLIADVTAHVLARYRRWHSAGTDGDGANFPFGLYHLAASGQTSWHGYACHIAEQARAAGAPLALDLDGIRPIPSSDWPTQAIRPAHSRLDTTRLCDTFGLRLPPWQASVQRSVARLIEGTRLCAR